MQIYLTDLKQHVEFNIGSAQHDVQTILTLKKVMPSIMELLNPILPKEQQHGEVTWESHRDDFELFKLLYQSWTIIELRLKTVQQAYSLQHVQQLFNQAQQYRQQRPQLEKYHRVTLDYLFLLHLHGEIDALLVHIGERFYLPTFQQSWASQSKILELIDEVASVE